MSDEKLTVEKLWEVLPQVCAQDTSADPDGWKPENPTWGHCAVATLVAQDLFGGKILRGSLEGTPFAKMRSHYWNMLGPADVLSGKETFQPFQAMVEQEDFTAAQFGDQYPQDLKAEERTRDYLLSNAQTKERYKTLMYRLARRLSGDNPLFNNPTFERCILNALDSPCQKLKFGCVIAGRGDSWFSANSCNDTIAECADFCPPGNCVRMKIQSRTESMIGACGHAEEWAMEQAIRREIPLPKCEMYVAGIDVHSAKALIKKSPDFTCLRCATQINMHKVGQIFVPVVNRWEALTPEQAVQTAKAYAMGEKKV